MDTLIGTFNLTDNQIANLGTIKVIPFLGGSYKHDTGEYVAVSVDTPTQNEIDTLTSAINSLPDVLDRTVYESRFQTKLMLGAMGLAFNGIDSVNLAPYLAVLQGYADFKNFKGIKDFITGLVTLNKATQVQADTLYGIFQQQGIDLSSY